jgi:ribonuclease P protein subunit RPR2
MPQSDKNENRKIALERVKLLLSQAGEAFAKEPGRAHRYARMARKLAMRYNVRLPTGLRRKICKGCGRYMVTGKNCRVRLSPRREAVIMTCLECGHVSRHPYRKGKKLL